MTKEKFSQAVTEILAMEYRNNREEIWVLMFHDADYNKKYITTIITKAIGLVSAIIKINEELKIGPGRGECTGFVLSHAVDDKYMDRQLTEKDLLVMKTEIENDGRIMEIYI